MSRRCGWLRRAQTRLMQAGNRSCVMEVRVWSSASARDDVRMAARPGARNRERGFALADVIKWCFPLPKL